MAKKKAPATKRRPKAKKMSTKAGTTAGATQRLIQFHRDQSETGAPQPGLLVDGSGLLSLRNHRMYRQGRVYRQRIKVHNRSTNTTLNHIEVYALRNTWYLRKAHQLAMKAYMAANAEVQSVTDKSLTRWLDFRVNCNPGAWCNEAYLQDIKFNFITGNFTYDYSANLAEKSLITNADGDEMGFSLIGGTSSTQYNILSEYNRIADTPDPLVGGASPGVAYGNLLSEGTEATATRMIEDGADAPYDMENIPLNVWEHVGTLHIDSASGEQTLSTPYVDCPLGVMLLVGSPPDLPDEADFTFQLEFAPGDYKGVASDAI